MNDKESERAIFSRKGSNSNENKHENLSKMLNFNYISLFFVDEMNKDRKIIIYRQTKDIGEDNYLCEIFVEKKLETIFLFVLQLK